MAFHDKGNGDYYLVCDNARRGMGCNYNSIRYEETEDTILANCSRLRPEQVLPNPDEQTELCDSLRQRVVGKGKELSDIDRRLNNLDDQLAGEDNKKLRQRFRDKMIELEQRRVKVESEEVEAERALTKAEQGKQSFTKWRKSLNNLRRGIDNNPELRLRLRAHLRELIDRIDVFTVGHLERYDPYGRTRDVEDWAEGIEAGIVEYNPGWKPDKEFYQFLEYVTKRRMSKEGRFVRVRFKTGSIVDMVPKDSLASGVQLQKDGRRKSGWRFVSPDVEKLWQDFQAKG